MKKIVIGTRGSRLALVQTYMVRDALLKHDPSLEIEVRVIKTKGDRFLQLALDASGDKGLFTKELEQELLEGSIDMAVHSLKDLPVEPVAGTCVAALLPRECTCDVLLGRRLEELGPGAIVGTSSRRRAYQLRQHHPQLDIRPIRGNVETRIAKMRSGDYDAIVMAYAGLKRLGLEHEIAQVLPIEVMVPAPGQGAIAVHTRAEDEALIRLLSKIHHHQTALEVETERRLLSSLGGGCALPLGCLCQIEGSQARLEVFYAREDGSEALHRSLSSSLEGLDETLMALRNELLCLHEKR